MSSPGNLQKPHWKITLRIPTRGTANRAGNRPAFFGGKKKSRSVRKRGSCEEEGIRNAVTERAMVNAFHNSTNYGGTNRLYTERSSAGTNRNSKEGGTREVKGRS